MYKTNSRELLLGGVTVYYRTNSRELLLGGVTVYYRTNSGELLLGGVTVYKTNSCELLLGGVTVSVGRQRLQPMPHGVLCISDDIDSSSLSSPPSLGFIPPSLLQTEIGVIDSVIC